MPREEDEFALSYYNSLSTWIDLHQLLALFELSAGDLTNSDKVSAAIRKVAARMPTYITLKEVKKRWGHGQEDIFPVAQFEKLWGDMSALTTPLHDTGDQVALSLQFNPIHDYLQVTGDLIARRRGCRLEGR